MSVAAFLQSHVLVVVLFLILFIIKAFMLFTNKIQALENLKRKTKVLDIVFGTLILVTGGYLMFQYSEIPAWLIVKVVLVFVAIPVAIIGMKKRNKPMVALALAIFVYIYGVAETHSLTMKKPGAETAAEAPEANVTEENGMVPEEKTVPAISEVMSRTATSNAKQIYLQQCEVCHTKKDKKGRNIGTDLTGSKLSLQQRKDVILNGRGLMPAFKGQISEQEAEEIAAFTQMLAQ